MKKAVIILPTYNEVHNIKSLIQEIFAVRNKIKSWNIAVLVVDSSSPDDTAHVVKKSQKKYSSLYLIETPKEGLGKAYVHGFRYALNKLKADVVFEMDADHSHDPQEIPHFLAQIEHGADFVIGSRYIPGGSIPPDWGIHRKIFSVLGNLIIRLGFMKFSITEWTNGYRAIKRWVIKKHIQDLTGYTGYVFQVALLDNAIKSGANIHEIPINFKDRTRGVSKIDSIEYIVQTLMYVFRHSSFIKFCIVGGIGFVVDFGISFILIEMLSNNIVISTIISAEIAIISNFIFNNYWSFSHKKLDHARKNMLWSFIKFNGVASGSIAIQAIGMQITTSLLGHAHWYIYKVFIISFIIIPYSYILYNKFVWKDK